MKMTQFLLFFLLACLVSCSTTDKKPDPVEPTPVPTEPTPTPEPTEPTTPTLMAFTPDMKFETRHIDGLEDFKDLPKADVYVLELSQVDDDVAAYAKEKGIPLVCYMSASYEDWRDDAHLYPESAKGNKMEHWDELWGNITDTALQDFLENRFVIAAAKGCKAVEIDNMGMLGNPTGFDVTKEQVLAAIIEIRNRAAKHGMGMFQKNSTSIADELQPYMVGVLNESCQRYKECGDYKDYYEAGKKVQVYEYRFWDCKPYEGAQVYLKSDYFGPVKKVCD